MGEKQKKTSQKCYNIILHEGFNNTPMCKVLNS